MKELEFKIDGEILKGGVPLPIAIAALGSFQAILDKSYLVAFDKNQITAQDREKFYLRATEFKNGSLLTYFEIVLQSVQLGLPLVSSMGPQNIWEYTKDSFQLLKLVCGAVKNDIEPKYEFNNDGDVTLQIGDNHHHYHGPVIQIAKRAHTNYQDLAHLLGSNKLSEISAGYRLNNSKDIDLTMNDRDAFDIPTKLQKETIELRCEIFDFNKYKNAGKLSVSAKGQSILPGEYNFTIFEGQDNVEYIYGLLKPQVTLHCLVEESISPFGGIEIFKLHVTGVSK